MLKDETQKEATTLRVALSNVQTSLKNETNQVYDGLSRIQRLQTDLEASSRRAQSLAEDVKALQTQLLNEKDSIRLAAAKYAESNQLIADLQDRLHTSQAMLAKEIEAARLIRRQNDESAVAAAAASAAITASVPAAAASASSRQIDGSSRRQNDESVGAAAGAYSGTTASMPSAAASASMQQNDGPPRLETRIVKRGDLIVRKGRGSIYKPIAILHRGDSVEVVGKDDANPRWLKVEANGQIGWVYEDALTTRGTIVAQGSSSGFTGSGAAAGGGFGASSTEASLVGAGWDAREYALKKNFNTLGLQTIMNERHSITELQLDIFQLQGKVGTTGGR